MLQKVMAELLEATITRFAETADSTLGLLTVGDLKLWTLEDAWRDNKNNISCIPTGRYLCTPHGWEPGNPHGFKYTNTYQVRGVPGRIGILFHALNNHTQTEGCIGPAYELHFERDKARTLQSAVALQAIKDLVGENSFWLTIKEGKANA